MTARQDIEAALAAGPTEGRKWELWTSCSWRRIPGVIEPTIQRFDNRPDLHATIETLKYVVAVQPSAMREVFTEHDAELAAEREKVRVLRDALTGLFAAYCSQMKSNYDFPGRPWIPERDNDEAALQARKVLHTTKESS